MIGAAGLRLSLVLCALAIPPALVGCLTPSDVPGSVDGARAPHDWAAIESTGPTPVEVLAQIGEGPPLRVAGHLWTPAGSADTVVLLVHGGGGLALEIWGPGPVPGYSFAHRLMTSGRAALVIDRPGYGGSDAHDGDLDEQARVLAEVTAALRRGAVGGASYRHVIVVGHSIGAYFAMTAQGGHHAFDAIVPIGWSHGGYREGWWACTDGQDDLDCLLHPDNSDPAVGAWVEPFFDDNEGVPPRTLAQLQANTGGWRAAAGGTRAGPRDGDEVVAAAITRPVLMILGKEDGLVEPWTQAEEEAVFMGVDDLAVVVRSPVAHWIWHHQDHSGVFATVLDWIEARGW